MEPIQLLTPAGTLTEHELYTPYISELSGDQLRDFYRHMVTERRLDQEATSLQRQGQLALWAPALGQEAGQVGTVAALKPTDTIFPTYREHAMALYRGVSPAELLALFRAVTHSGWEPRKHNFHIYTLVLGAQTLHAAGWAMAIQRDVAAGTVPADAAEDEIVLACLGDGASSQGDVHESMVFASSYELPVLYFLQNNHWAISVPAATQSRHPLALRASGYGFEGIRVDGNDVLASYAVARHFSNEVRTSGPKLIESVTYRVGAHTTADDPTKYRTDEELEEWKAKDPIQRYKTWLSAQDHADETYYQEVEAEAADLAAELRTAVQNMVSDDITDVMSTVYAEPHRQLDVERAWLADYEASFADAGPAPADDESSEATTGKGGSA